MDEVAHFALRDADLALVLFDMSEPPTAEDWIVANRVRALQGGIPTVVALTKVDAIGPVELSERQVELEALIPGADASLPVSAVRGRNLNDLLDAIVSRLPVGPRYYPEETITDRHEREIAADLIRAAAMEALHDELPHSIAVRIDEYEEQSADNAYIKATLFAERESQKGIVIGKNGSMIKRIGTAARNSIEAMSGRSVFLELRVKVEPGWRDDENALRRLGYLTSPG
jgi:GTP-binding protein Era